MNFVPPQNTDLTSSNWTDVTIAAVLNTTNLHEEVTISNTGASTFYRLVSQ